MRKNKKLVCPACGSDNIQFVGNQRKAFSVGKAIGGAVLTSSFGGVGSLAGFIGKKSKKNTFVCLNCGKEFKVKG
jgi:predicted RNA-binding Zn-ribbon protein involved in translation (DUF1610 family)